VNSLKSWHKEHGFKKNPLFQSPLKRNDTLRGYGDLQKNLLYLISSGSMSLIIGKQHTGKTMLLKNIIDTFRGDKRIIFIDLRKISKRLDIKKVIHDRLSFFERLRKKKPKDIILLLDNAQDLSSRSFELLHYYFDKKYLHSVVFTAVDLKTLNIPKSLLDRIGKRIFHTQILERADAVEMIKEKLGGKDLLKDYQLEILYVLADKNIPRVLVYTDAVLQYQVDNPDVTLSSKLINKAIKNVGILDAEIEDEHEVCSDCHSELLEVCGTYRCVECDSFCFGCGAIVDDDDIECPYCGKQFEV
jgi:ABC-type cobalamin/Fe3+-siderophores transport system ATPase subunit